MGFLDRTWFAIGLKNWHLTSRRQAQASLLRTSPIVECFLPIA